MGNLTTAYQWAIDTCNASNIGYSQAYRRGQTVNGVTYYDCSSFIAKALTVGGYYKENPWFTTHYMRSMLTEAGFKEYPTSVAWMKGDILLNVTMGHTEMCYEGAGPNRGGVTMGAHTDGVPLPEQVSINNFVTQPSYYEYVYRAEGSVKPLVWVTGNFYLSETEMKNNAYVFYSTMFFKGFTLNSIAGMLGNAESESKINPGVWQDLDEGNYELGFGLFQWTPATNYTDWATSHGYEIDDGDKQCEWVDTETDRGQWIPTEKYQISWEEFKKSTDSAENLASAFLWNFERPSVDVEKDRRAQARKWYEYLKKLSPYPPDPWVTKRRMPLYFYLFL